MKPALFTPLSAFGGAPVLAAAFMQAQNASGTANITTIAATAFGSPVITGNAILVACGWFDVGTITSVTDTAGNTYTAAQAKVTNGDVNNIQLWYALNVTGGSSFVVTANLSAPSSFRRIVVFEVSGLVAKDQNAAAVAAATATPSAGPVTTTSDGQFIFGAAWNVGNNGSVFAPGAGFTEPANATANAGDYELQAEYQVQGLAGSISATWTRDSSGNNLVAMASFA